MKKQLNHKFETIRMISQLPVPRSSVFALAKSQNTILRLSWYILIIAENEFDGVYCTSGEEQLAYCYFLWWLEEY